MKRKWEERRIRFLALVSSIFASGCVSVVTTVGYKDAATGEQLGFEKVAEARSECAKAIAQTETTDGNKPIVASTAEGAIGAVAGAALSEVTREARQSSDLNELIDECLLKKGIERVTVD